VSHRSSFCTSAWICVSDFLGIAFMRVPPVVVHRAATAGREPFATPRRRPDLERAPS